MPGKLKRLATNPKVDMKTDGGILYVVPANAKCVVTEIFIREPTASLAGGTDYDFGVEGGSMYASAVDLSALTDTASNRSVKASTSKVFLGGEVISVLPQTGSTLAANAAVDLIGYEIT